MKKAKVLRNGQWINVEIGAAAREREQRHRASRRKELEDKLARIELWLEENERIRLTAAKRRAESAVREENPVKMAGALTDVLFTSIDDQILEQEADRLREQLAAMK